MDTQALTAWAQQHEVTWELSPWHEMAAGRVTSVGLELRLFARHDAEAHPSPGCALCVNLYEQLRQLAMTCLPTEPHATRYDIDPFDSAFHLRPEHHWIPEIQVALHITHRDGYLAPLDECEKRCADEIQRALRRLGAQPRVWSEMSVAKT